MDKLIKTKLYYTDSFQFDRGIFDEGSPVCYKYEENDHYFYSLVKDCGPFILSITNGTIENHIDIREVTENNCQIIPLEYFDEYSTKGAEELKKLILKPCRLFDTDKIPVGSIFIDADGTSFIVQLVDPFFLTLVSTGKSISLHADVFFGLDFEEYEESCLYLPPLYGEEQSNGPKKKDTTSS